MQLLHSVYSPYPTAPFCLRAKIGGIQENDWYVIQDMVLYNVQNSSVCPFFPYIVSDWSLLEYNKGHCCLGACIIWYLNITNVAT
jgi:hypothetical protein